MLSGLWNMEFLFGPALSVALVLMARVNDSLLALCLVQTNSVVVQLRVSTDAMLSSLGSFVGVWVGGQNYPLMYCTHGW